MTSRMGFTVDHRIQNNNQRQILRRPPRRQPPRELRVISNPQQNRQPPQGRACRSRAALSLPELLVVVGIIAVLLVLLLPVLAKLREKSAHVVCGSRLYGLVIGCQQYANVNEGWFPAAAGDGQPAVVPNLLPSRLLNDLKEYVAYPAVGPATSLAGLPPAVQCPTVERSDVERGPFATAEPGVVTYYTGYAYLGGLGPDAGEVRLPAPAPVKGYVPGRVRPPAGPRSGTQAFGPPLAPPPSGSPTSIGRALHADRAPAKRGDKGVLWADEVYLSSPTGGYWRFAHARHAAAAGPAALTYADPRACLGQHRAYVDGHVEWIPAERLGLQAGGEVGVAGVPKKKPSPMDAVASYKAGTSYWWY